MYDSSAGLLSCFPACWNLAWMCRMNASYNRLINEVCLSCEACFNLYLCLRLAHPSNFLCLFNNWWEPTVIIVLLPQNHLNCTKSYVVFAKPQTNVTFFTLCPGNNLVPKRSCLLRGCPFKRSRKRMNEPFSWFAWKCQVSAGTFFFMRSIIMMAFLLSVFCLGSLRLCWAPSHQWFLR